MHDTACLLRPAERADRIDAPTNADPTCARNSPFAPLRESWRETIALDLTVNATTEEGCTSRIIHGPFRIDEIAFRSSASGGVSQQLRFVFGNLQPAPQAQLDGGAGLPGVIASDSARTVATYYATNVYERHNLNQVFQTGTARLGMILNNTTAGAVTIAAHVTITHLIPASAERDSPSR